MISLSQQILQARQAVLHAPKAIKDLRSQLSRLYDTVQQVKREPELQVPEIYTQLKEIYSAATELEEILRKMEKLQKRSRFKQGLHALGLGQGADFALKAALNRLRDAQNELGLRVGLAHVGITSGATKRAERIEHGVQTLIKGGVRSAVQPRFVIDGNVTRGTSDQQNGISVMENSTGSTAMVSKNEALNNSRQRNVILVGSASNHLPKGFAD